MTFTPLQLHRRQFLRTSSSLLVAGAVFSIGTNTARANIGAGGFRQISLDHLHTNEKITLAYANGDTYIPAAMQRLNRFLRDHYSGTVGHMDPTLFDLINKVRASLKTDVAIEVISGYRDPHTNERLRKTRGGGVAKRSLHMVGQAMDLRLKGVPLDELRDAAKELALGGVGYYPKDGFVHMDTGRVRSW